MVVSNLEGGNRSWNLQFHRAFHERGVERACSLLKHLYSNMPRGERDDTLTWKLNRFGVFDVYSYYNLLADPDGSSSIPFPWKCIWSTKVPKRVSFFLWIAARGSILTIDNLVLRRLPLVNWCCMCRCDEETVDHLLLHCKFAYVLWSEVFLIF